MRTQQKAAYSAQQWLIPEQATPTPANAKKKKRGWKLRHDLLLAAALLIAVPLSTWYFMHVRDQHYFRNPLSVPLSLSANFGELRKDHFHMGLDIRTRGRENLPVHAAADGYVSAIIIEEEGYGNAIEITHPNHTTTLYAHLNRFFDSLQQHVSQVQYLSKQWEQQLRFLPGQFPVKKGQFIAYSGNTGHSEAPHLHMEVRDTETGQHLNPQHAGIGVEDDLPPVVQGLYWYNRQQSTYETSCKSIPLAGKEGTYTSKSGIVSVSSPLISLGIRAKDKIPGSHSLMGIAAANLTVDGNPVHYFSLDRFTNTDSRYINACIDYTRWHRYGTYVQHLSTLPGNNMPGFLKDAQSGLIILRDQQPHTVRIQVSDASGNQSTLSFRIQWNGQQPSPSLPPANATLLLPNQENIIQGKYAMIRFSARAFYDTVYFQYREQPSTGADKASPLIHLHHPAVPVHDSFRVQIRSTLRANDPLRNKVVMQLFNGNERLVVKGNWKQNSLQASFNQLGTVQLLIDTMPPRVQSVTWEENNGDRVLQVTCDDNCSPIAAFRAEYGGQWLLFEKKGNVFTYRPDSHWRPGRHLLNIWISDVAGNITRKTLSIER